MILLPVTHLNRTPTNKLWKREFPHNQLRAVNGQLWTCQLTVSYNTVSTVNIKPSWDEEECNMILPVTHLEHR